MKRFLFVILLIGICGSTLNALAYYPHPHTYNEMFSLPNSTLDDYAVYTVNSGIMFCRPDDTTVCRHVYWNSSNHAVSSFTYNSYYGRISLNLGYYGGSPYVNIGSWFNNNTNSSASYYSVPGDEFANAAVNTSFEDVCANLRTSSASFVLTDIDTNNTCVGSNIPKLTIVLDQQAGGGVVSLPSGDGIYCGVDNYTICQLPFDLNSNVELEAYPNAGWVFLYWDDGTNHITENPHTFTMDAAKTVTAVFKPSLQFPLSGTLEDRKLTHFFWGDTWAYGECPTGTDKLHVGVDLSATYGEEVDAAHDGIVKKIFTGDHSQWADAIVIESTDGQFTTVYWHVLKYGSLSEEDIVTKGQQIATVANLGSNTHFHFGVRLSAYSNPESYAGALPVADGCGYLAFPEKFIDPETAIYE